MPFADGEQYGSLFAGVGHSRARVLVERFLYAASVPVDVFQPKRMNNQGNMEKQAPRSVS
jgi:hypothetical protein